MRRNLVLSNAISWSHLSILNLNTLLYLLFFFPSVTFGLLTAEIFPWAFLISLLLYKRFSWPFFLVFGFLIIHSFLSVVTVGLHIFPDTVRSFFAYSNALVSFALVSSLSLKHILRLIKLIFWLFLFLVTLGLLQHFSLINFLDPIIKFFVPRGGAQPLFASNRGIRLLAIEPARAGNELFFLYLVVRTIFIKKFRFLTDLLMVLYLALFVKSSMALMFLLLSLLILYNVKLFFVLPFMFIGFHLIDFESFGGRAIDLFVLLSKLNSYSDILFILMKTSGNRITSIFSSYLYGLYTPFGGGMGNWLESSRISLKMTGIDLSQLNYFKQNGLNAGSRSSGFFSNLILETGITGLFVVFTYVMLTLRKYWSISTESKCIILIFFIKIFFVGAVGHPVAWICTLIILRYLYDRNKLFSRRTLSV